MPGVPDLFPVLLRGVWGSSSRELWRKKLSKSCASALHWCIEQAYAESLSWLVGAAAHSCYAIYRSG